VQSLHTQLRAAAGLAVYVIADSIHMLCKIMLLLLVMCVVQEVSREQHKWGSSGYHEQHITLRKTVEGVHVETEEIAITLPDGNVERRCDSPPTSTS
jgi:hypothetical protein